MQRKSKADQKRLHWIHEMPCICCQHRGVSQPSMTSAHHLVDNGYRRLSGGDQATIPLCLWHHQGYTVPPSREDDMKYLYGPSLALHKKEFIATFGTERSLLAFIDLLMETA